jgi:hypothetical protein
MARMGMSTIFGMSMARAIIMGMGMSPTIIAMDMSHTRMAIIIAMTMIKPAVATTSLESGALRAIASYFPSGYPGISS